MANSFMGGMRRPNLALPGPVKEVLDHRVAGPALKVVVAYVLLVEVGVQLVFGRLQWFGLDVGFQSGTVPRAIFLNGAAIGMLYALLGMGLILVYRANRIINFAQAQLGSVPAVTALLLNLRKDVNYFLVLPIVIIGAAVLGALVNGFLRRWRDAPRLIVTVVTIGISLLLIVMEVLVQDWITGDLVSSNDFRTPWSRFGLFIGPLRFSGDFLVAAVATILISAALAAFFRFTDMGIAVRASAENGERASLLGIPISRVSMVVWIIAAVMSAIAVFLRAPVSGLSLGSSIGPSVLLYGLAAAVIARMESLPLCVIAGMGIGIVDQSALFGTRRSSLAIATMLVVILVALLAQKGRMARALDAGVATWQAAKEYRPVPFELRGVREVVLSRGLLTAIAGFCAFILPVILDEKFAGRFTIVVITAMVAVSLVVLTGWAGQISLGQFGFAGIGAAVAGALGVRDVDFFVCLALAGLAGALAAVLIGLPALRIQGPFLAVTTLAFSFTVQYFFLNPSYFGEGGQIADLLPHNGDFVHRPKLYEFFSTRSDTRFYFVCLIFLVLSILACRSLRKHRMGRVLIGVRDNSRGVQAYGVNLTSAKLSAFAISGFIAALAGGLFAFYLQSVDANAFRAEDSISVFTIAVIGGLTSLPGAIMGAVAIEGIPFLFDGDDTVRLLTSSVGLLVLLYFVPGGLSEIYFRSRDTFLRWVAKRNDIHVPSLVADSLVTPDEQSEHVVEAAEHRIESGAPLVAGVIRCPVCELNFSLEDAARHDHLRAEVTV